MTLDEVFNASATTHLEKVAIFYGEKEITYDSLLRQTIWTARQLKAAGIREGDRVGIWLKNRPEFIPSYFGILVAGAVVVPINNFLKPDEVNFIAEDAGINLIVTDESMGEGIRQIQTSRRQLKVHWVESLENASLQDEGSLPTHSRKENDLAVIVYTSGTTGHPKGAMLSHGNLLANVESCRQILHAVDFDRFTLLLPMFHSFMMTVCVLLPLRVGGSIVLVKSLHPPKAILQEMLHRQATILPAIPQLFRTLAHTPMPAPLPFRICISGAAPLPGEILKEFTEKTGIPLLEGYGLSEASPVVAMNPLQGPWVPGSIGIPLPQVELSIQDEEGRLLKDGEAGELCVRGPNVMQGYWNQPEETEKTLRKGWLLTGDIGYRNEAGYYFITDRKKDMLLVNGINVYPREIEEILYKHPGVKEAAVIGKPDARKGEQPWAFVSAKEGFTLDEKEILGFVRNQLADYKVPKKVIILPALPRNATGKILKKELRHLEAETM